MAARTTSQTGLYSSTSTWGGAAPPGPGDTATIAPGHVVTLDIDVTGLAGLTVGSTSAAGGELTWGTAGKTLNLAGDLTLSGYGILTGGPNGVLEFDNAGRTWTFGAWFGAGMAFRTQNTTATERFTIRTVAGGTNVSVVTLLSRDGFDLNLAHTDFLRIGDATHDALQLQWALVAGRIQTLDDVIFDGGGAVSSLDTAPSTCGWTLTGVKFQNTLASHTWQFRGLASPSVSRSADSCIFDNPPYLNGNGSVYTRNVFLAGFDQGSGNTTDWAQFGEATEGDGNGNLIRLVAVAPGATLSGGVAGNYVLLDAPAGPVLTGTATSAANSTQTCTLTDSSLALTANQYQAGGWGGTNGYCLYIVGGKGAGQCKSILGNTSDTFTLLYPWATDIPDGTSQYAVVAHLANCHALDNTNMFGTSGTVDHVRNLVENTGADNNGNLFSNVAATGVTTFNLSSNLFLPSASRDNPANLCSMDGNSRKVRAAHNTVWVGGQSLLEYESASIAAGQLDLFKDNLAVCDPTLRDLYVTTGGGNLSGVLGPYLLNLDIGAVGSSTQDTVAPANCTNNGGYGLKTGASGYGFNTNQSATINAGGVSVDPQFADSTRNLGAWAVARGHTASVSPLDRTTAAITAIKADPTLVGSDLIPWVQAGFAPANTAYTTAASDGGTIGAVATEGTPTGNPQLAAATPECVATLTASGVLNLRTAAPLAGSSTLTASASLGQHASAALSGSSTLAAAASVGSPGAAADLAVQASLTAAATLHQAATLPLAAVSTLAANAVLKLRATAASACVATVAADASVGQAGASASASLAAVATLTATAAMPMPASAALACVAGLTADASTHVTVVFGSLIAAIVDRVLTTPELAAAINDQFYVIQAPPGAADAPPFGVLVPIGSRPRWTTLGRSGYEAFFQASFFGDADLVHGTILPAFLAAFDPFMDPLEVTGQYFLGCFATDDHLAPDVGHDPSGEPVFHQVIEFTVAMGIAR